MLWGATIAVFSVDRSRRHAQGRRVLGEPEFGTLLLVTLLCNAVALPYYFYTTRGGPLGVLTGVLFLFLCMTASVAIHVVTRLALGLPW